MVYDSYDDSSVDKISFSDIRKMEHLDPNLDYMKTINFIEEELHLYGASFDNIDYTSAKFLLDYAKEHGMRLFFSPARRLFF